MKFLKFSLCFAAGFTLVHGLLFPLILTARNLYETVLYHYSDSLIWYTLFFGLPSVGGLALWFLLRYKQFLKSTSVLFGLVLVIQLTFTITAAIKNSAYWGYAFKRPALFSELNDAETILSCSGLSNYGAAKKLYLIQDTTKTFNLSFGRKDPYYGSLYRPFMLFEDNASQKGDLHALPKIYKDKQRKISPTTLERIDTEIKATHLVDRGDACYSNGGNLNGFVTEFRTSGNLRYIYAGLRGGEVANDHYPFYEFLFASTTNGLTLINFHKYYTDLAGLEGMEYANLAPAFSALLTLTGLLALILISIVNLAWKKLRAKRAAPGANIYPVQESPPGSS